MAAFLVIHIKNRLKMQQHPINTLFLFFLYYMFLVWMGKMAGTYRLRTAKRTDKRVKVMNEIIQAIQVIKMYAWETSFANLVDKIRK